MAKTAPKRKAANGYKFAEPLPKGEILQDLSKKQWKLGPSIGKGGFGEIYSAQEVGVGGSKYPYVVKIEPHANGPLFVEMHFYMRNAKYEDVEAFKKERGLKMFGMPLYLGSGSHENKNQKYRFIVMEKFGTDLWKVFLDNNRIFPATTVFKVAIQILDVLEYIHNRGYIHADIKGANILMGTTKETQNKQVYLVDFGLACKYNGDSVFKPDPKKAHDGTIEYLSRDAHQGVPSRRGDLEILAYNIIQWLGCSLPWENHLKDPKLVQQSKEEYMANVPKFMKACFEKKSPPGPVVDFLNYHSTLKHNSAPDYRTIRKIFLSGLDKGDALGKPLHFSPSKKTPVKRKKDDIASPKQKKGRKISSNDDRGSADEGDTQTKLQKKVRGGKQTSPKRKNIRKKFMGDQSEDEKENIVGDGDDDSLAETQLTDKEDIDDDPLPKRKRKGEKDMETDENILHEDVQDAGTSTRRGRARINYQVDSENEIKPKKKIIKIPADIEATKKGKCKMQKQSISKRKVGNANKLGDLSDQPQEDEPIYHEDIKDTEDIKDNECIKDNEESNSAPTRRGRARINYDEGSGEEKKFKRKPIKKSASTKEVHVTGDSMDGYTDAMKEVLLKKIENGKPKEKKKESQVENEDMVGYTESMKEIALKNREKIISKRSRQANPLPGPSTSSSKRIMRSRKGITVPLSHNDISDYDQSDSD